MRHSYVIITRSDAEELCFDPVAAAKAGSHPKALVLPEVRFVKSLVLEAGRSQAFAEGWHIGNTIEYIVLGDDIVERIDHD